jgi:GH35 family endo-1,4-beta-xylanase
MQKISILFICFILFCTKLWAQNLVPNPGFEQGSGSTFTSWDVFNGALPYGTFSETTTEQRSGSRALQANLASPSGGNQWRLQIASAPITMVTGSTYTFRIWVKSTVAGNNIRFSTNPSALYSQNFNIANANTWQQITWNFTANTTSARIVLDLANGPSAATYYLDDMEMLQPANNNPSLVMNGGFEQVYNVGTADEGWNNWGKWNGAAAMLSTDAAGEFRSGALGLKAVIPSSATAEYQVQLVSDPATMIVGGQYTFSIYAKRAASSTSSTSTIRFSTNGGTALYSGNYTPGSDWTRHSWTFTATSASTRIALDLGGSGAGVATYFLDDASLQLICGSFTFTPPADQTPIATGKSKFLGNVWSAAQVPNSNKYFNQVTPENAGKWGSVETADQVFNWTDLDASRKFASDNNFPFRFHVLFWGAQQPTWLKPLSNADKIRNIREWLAAISGRYKDESGPFKKPEYIEVFNEVLNDPPNNLNNATPQYSFRANNTTDAGSGDYVDALRSLNAELGTAPWEYDYVVNAFKLARQYFGCTTKLMINEYGVENDSNTMGIYAQIVNALKAEKLIDAVGLQTHSFSTQIYGSYTPASIANRNAILEARLNQIASTGLPIMVTEMDIDGDVTINSTGNRVTTGTQAEKDAFQRSEFENIFPIYWNHPSVIGVTMWGYRTGHWRSNQAAYLMDVCTGSPRPSMDYLNTVIRASNPTVGDFPLTASCNLKPSIECKNATISIGANGLATLSASDVTASATDPEQGALTYTLSQSSFDCSQLGTHDVTVTVTDDAGLSASCTATVTVVDDTAPTATATASPAALWPPNNKMVDITVDIAAIENCNTASCKIISVSSNEGSASDWVITGDKTLQLRASRNGNGNGRVYTITVECTDASSNSSTSSTTVTVAHDQGGRLGAENIDNTITMVLLGNPSSTAEGIKVQLFSSNTQASLKTELVSSSNGAVIETIVGAKSGDIVTFKNKVLPAMYFIRSTQDGKVATLKVVKQ